ncbi:MltA domain-containing protein, partial [Bacteriovoracaceae bacterium]|nr:MltA domain-containing protein [Bacteriovoracaceae bacterium]
VKQLQFGNQVYPVSVLKESLLHFEQILNRYKNCLEQIQQQNCMTKFNLSINQDFNLYLPDSGKGNQTKFTAYYSPDIYGGLNKTKENKNPVYKNPKVKSPRDLFLSRDEIDYKNKLSGKNLEIAYTKNSHFDLYLMMVEGGGRLIIPTKNGVKYKYLSYDGSNKHPLNFISRYLLAKGYMTRDKLSIRNQRNFLLENPHLEREVMTSNPSYTFFKITDSEPLGIDSIPLTVERSVAIDRRIYKFSGYLNFIQARRPYLDDSGELKFKSMNMFRIAQDTGGAIRGPGRMDIYFGFGDQAELAANHVHEMGMNYFLVKKP